MKGNPGTGPLRHALLSVVRWFDSYAGVEEMAGAPEKKIDLWRVLPFLFLHLACLGVFYVGWSPVAVWTAVGLYVVRMFGITAFYHRYFSHNAFKASRGWTFVFAVIGGSSVQRGPLWWAGHHREHHLRSDTKRDIHSPVVHGFWWEFDLSYYALAVLSRPGIVREICPVPESVKRSGLRGP